MVPFSRLRWLFICITFLSACSNFGIPMATLTPTVTPTPISTPTPTPEPSIDAFTMNRRLARTVNIGNALEAPTEGEWGVTIKDEYFQIIHDAGFTAVRLPVRWSAHALKEAPYTIDAAFFDRVDHVVNQALSQHLAVIVNVHHYEEMAL